MKYALCTALFVLCACSKGGLSENKPQSCPSISDPEPVPGEMPPPKALYAELRHVESGTVLPVMLEGIGGSYSGSTRPIEKCDPPGNYFVERLVLIDAAGGLLATAVRSGSSYVLTYKNGATSAVSASAFSRYYAGYSPAAGSAVPTLTALMGGGMSRQGDKATITAAAMAPMDDCGLKDSQWFLTTTPGVMGSPASNVVISGGSGSGALRISPDLPASTYVVEGRLNSKSGRYALVRRMSSTDTTYSLYNPSLGTYSPTSIPVVRVEVAANPDADRVAPQPVSMEAMPTKALRCQAVALSLKVSDDKGLPSMQEVKVRLGPLSQPNLVRATLTGGAMLLSGSFTVPLDAPPGIWVGYPESVLDAAGNIGTGSLSADKFTLSGPGIGTPVSVQAATFIVEGEGTTTPLDMGLTTPDLATAPDLRPLEQPATLVDISVMPTSAMVDKPISVTVTWMGMGLK